MANIKVSQKELCALSKISPAQVEPILTEIGIPLEKKEGDELSLEITPNRPDWLSVEGIARSCASYSSGSAKKYSAQKSKIGVIMDSSVKSVRPFFAGAYATNAKLTPAILDSLIQLQEKLHDTLGRNRKKLAIGLHDAKNITPPFTYKAVSPTSIKFVPLGMGRELDCSQILSQHEKGRKYANLVGKKCPIIADKNGKTLSFPPIINGELTRVSEKTTSIFIDCTGTHKESVFSAASILASALADRGCTIHTISISGRECDIFKMQKTPLKLKEANSLLGTNLSLQDAKKHLARMGHFLEGAIVLSPSYRADILHPVDLAEDMAISIGYNNFEAQLMPVSTIGKSESFQSLHEACLGLGFFEASSWILTNQRVLENCQISPEIMARVQNPLTQEFTTLRPAIYPNLIEIFSNSKSQQMPQNLYELGPVVKLEGAVRVQQNRLCLARAHPKSNFSEIHSDLKALLDSLSISYSLVGAQIEGFIEGRCAKIIIGSKDAGIIGEVHPQVLENFSIEQPVCLFEINSGALL
ncbi:MAG: phenylalanine--tRNA ligase subunit beta [Candidatus Micrarchaeota archaeon]